MTGAGEVENVREEADEGGVVVPDEALGVELDACDGEGFGLDGLHRAVRAPGRDAEARRQILHGLVMAGIHLDVVCLENIAKP